MQTTRRALLTAAALAPLVSMFDVAAQYAGGLPPGFVAAEVDNQPIDGLNTPITPNPNPIIGGRTNTGAAEVVVAIANETEVVQVFALPVDGKGRFKGPVPEALDPATYQLYFTDSLVGSFVIDGDATATDKEKSGSSTDIAQAVALPQDFGGAVPNLGLLEGLLISQESEARRRAASAGDTSKEAINAEKRALDEAGWKQQYVVRLAVPDPADAARFLVQVNGVAVEFAKPEQASGLFPELGAPDAAIDGPVIAEEIAWAEFSGVTNDTEVPYRAMLVAFRQGSIVGRIVYADLNGGTPDISVISAAATRVVERAAAIQVKDVTGLGAQMVRLDDSTGLVSVDEAYDWLNGEITPLYQESDKSLASRTAVFGSSLAAFTSDAVVTAGEASLGGRYTTSLLSFATPEEAAAWLANVPALIENDPLTTYSAVAVVADAPSVGDASSAYAVTRMLGEVEASGFRVYAVAGAAGMIVELVGEPGMPIEEAIRLANAQAACSSKPKCGGGAALPGSPEAAAEATKQAETGDQSGDQPKDKKDKKDQSQSGGVTDVPADASGGVQEVPAGDSGGAGVQDVPADGGSGGVQEVPAEGSGSSGGTSIAPERTKVPSSGGGGVVDVTPAP